MLFRYGDVLIGSIEKIPQKAKKVHSNVIVKGEMTGHSHQIQNSVTAQLYQDNTNLYL